MENQEQNSEKVSAAIRKQENNKKFDINKRIQKFITQTKTTILKNKKLEDNLHIQRQQQDAVFSKESNIKSLLVMHHGYGSENDYDVLKKFLNNFGENKIYVFPAYSYGYVQFETTENLQKCLKSMETHNFDQIFKFKEGEQPKQYYETEGEQYVIYVDSQQFINTQGREHQRYCFYVPTTQPLDFFEVKCENTVENASTNVNIPGLYFVHNFISEEEEKQLIDEANSCEWSKLSKRYVQHYGHEFVYGSNTVNLDKNAVKPFPDQAKTLAQRMDQEIKKYGANQPPLDQLTINKYEPGCGIPPHVDSHSPFEDYFAIVSGGDGTVMTFKNVKNEEVHFYMPRRALIIMSNEARYAWVHSISARKVDKVDKEMHFRKERISYTYRSVRQSQKCECKWNYFCDSQGFKQETMSKMKNNTLIPKGINKKPEGNTVFARSEEEVKQMEKIQQEFQDTVAKQQDQLKPSQVEQKYVYDVYEKIAPHFSSTRYKPWPKVSQFLDSIPTGSLVADVGCGNGKYLSCPQNQNGEFFMIGTDRAQNFVEICREREKDCQVFSADSLKLPWRDNIFDAVISIAVIHHFSNETLRMQALKEIHRIMNKDGRALIYVWAMEQKEKNFQEQDIFVPWHNQFKFEEKAEKMNEKKQKGNKKDKKLQEQKNQENQDQQQEEEKEQQQQKQQQQQDDKELTHKQKIELEAQKHKEKEKAEEIAKVDAEKQSVVYKRYYHVFKQGELEQLVEKTGLFTIEDNYFDHANWVVILKKK